MSSHKSCRTRESHPGRATDCSSILVLILIVLVTYVFPSDDRRCRMEAQRLPISNRCIGLLGKWFTARASIDSQRKTALLELTRETASLTEKLWETGDQRREHEVRDPVLIDEVDTAIVARQKMGRAFIIFAGNKTEGGVVVLVLNEAVYSVVVPPGKGLVRVEEGRAPASKTGVANQPTLPSMTDESKAVKSSYGRRHASQCTDDLDDRPRPAIKSERTPEESQGTEPTEIDTTPREPLEDMLDNSTDTNGFSGVGSSGTGSSKIPNSTTPTTPNSNQPNTNSGCRNSNCMPPPDGRTFRLDNATVTEPNELRYFWSYS